MPVANTKLIDTSDTVLRLESSESRYVPELQLEVGA